jgi:hypothetical protein
MMAFVDHEVPMIPDDIVNLCFANKALNQGDINLTLRRMEYRGKPRNWTNVPLNFRPRSHDTTAL